VAGPKKTPPSIAEGVLEEMEGRTPVFTHARVEAGPKAAPATLPLLTIAEKVVSPDEAEAIVEKLLGYSDNFDILLVNPENIGGLAQHETLFHPAIIRAAARRGAAFYFAADKRVHRSTLSRDEQKDLSRVSPAVEADGAPFYWTPPWFADLKAFIDANMTALLIGPAGCGKSEATERVFKQRAQPLDIVSCTPAMTADDLEGRTDLVAGETVFTLAAPAIAVRDGHGLLLDEADAAPAEACYSLYRCLDGKDMRITRMGEKGVIPRHANFRAVGTQNTQGRGDDRGLHHGRSYQDEAFLDRWDQAIQVSYPEPENEIVILRKRVGVSAASAQKVVEVATALRKALAEDDTMFVCSIRRTLAVAKNLGLGMTPERAWGFAIGNRLTAEDQSKVKEVLQRIYGDRLKAKP